MSRPNIEAVPLAEKIRPIVKAIGGLVLVCAGTAHAALKTDPFTYDPTFNAGVVLEDRFAATSLNTSNLGLRAVIGAGGDIVSSGIVGPAYLAASPPGNLGLVRYGSGGERLSWANPSANYSYFFNVYVDYPNIQGAAVGWVRDLKLFNGYLYALVDLNLATGRRDVRIYTFTDGDGTWIADTPAFTTPLDETGAALVPYCHHELVVGGVPQLECNLVAVANYATPGGRSVVTMKNFVIGANDGSLAVNDQFGISGNGAMDQGAPDSLCVANSACSWSVTAATGLRTADDHSPTLYLAGTMLTSSTESDGVVIAVDGASGALATSFGGGTGYYVNYQADSSGGIAIAASTTGDATTDIIYLATNGPDSCGVKSVVTKLRASVTLGGGPNTLPDFNWGSGGARDVGGNPGGCQHTYTNTQDMILDGDRLVLAGYEDLNSTIPSPMFAVVRVSDGTLSEYNSGGFTALRADGSPWGGGVFHSVVARGNGRYAVTGYLYDASAGDATLFGTAGLVSDRIFGNDLE